MLLKYIKIMIKKGEKGKNKYNLTNKYECFDSEVKTTFSYTQIYINTLKS